MSGCFISTHVTAMVDKCSPCPEVISGEKYAIVVELLLVERELMTSIVRQCRCSYLFF